MRSTRKQHRRTSEVAAPLIGRRNRKSAPNSLQFFARIEGEQDHNGHVRSANGMRWKVA